MQASYRQALQRLEALINYERNPPSGSATRHFHLDAFRTFLDALGAPDRNLSIIHIAGTRGKGTVATLLAEALHQQGHRVGLFRSPHVDSIRERITVDGRWISREAFTRQAHRVLDAMGDREIPDATFRTHFEALVAIALLHFDQRRVDWAILETGLGGRLDATNVVTPRLTVLTALGVDHTRVLGTTLPEIAAEKAGIIKPGVPCVLAPQPRGLPAAARGVITARAQAVGARLVEAKRRWPWEITAHGLRGLEVSLRGGECTAKVPRPGRSAASALATVCTCLEILGLPVQKQLRLKWPFAGRAEVLSCRPPVLLDGAHDPLAARHLADLLEEVAPGSRRLCLAMMLDKDAPAILRALRVGPGDRIALPRLEMPRAQSPETLQRAVEAVCPEAETKCFAKIGPALRWLAEARPRGTLCVTGSFYHLAPARRALKRLAGG